jgi:hypothetical protein
MHEILLMRNMHDTGGADIPILITNWDENAISRAMEYWSELSKGEWTDSERSHKCAYFHHHSTTFCKTHHYVRHLQF